jgi:aminoglycoside/choline kinase family phosphotransferase
VGGLELSAVVLDPRVEGFLVERFGTGFEVVPLSGDASTRRYFRLQHRGARSVLALYPEPFDAPQLPFLIVHELLRSWGLPVPELRDHDGARGILLLEDLGDLTLQEVLRATTDDARDRLYRGALTQLALLQRASSGGPREAACFQSAFDIEKLSWELHYFVKHFLEGYRGCDLGVEDRATLAHSFDRLSQEIASWPRVLCHRDFHSRNLMHHRDVLYWIDFQDARLGPAVYDLASLLRDAYVDLPEDLVSELAEEFRQQVVPQDTPATFMRRFELMAVQRTLKALGTFGYMASVRGTQVYVPYIPRTLANARRNLVRQPELAGLHRVLARHVEELQ